jgi:hypothetical protein
LTTPDSCYCTNQANPIFAGFKFGFLHHRRSAYISEKMQASTSEAKERDESLELEESEGSEISIIAESSEADTEDEIAHVQEAGLKSKKTLKRKLRATSPTHFGETLNELLVGQPNEEIPLTLPRRFERQREREKEDIHLRKAQGQAKKDAEEVGRITDIIGGWGAENERALRKVAQRGGKYLVTCNGTD